MSSMDFEPVIGLEIHAQTSTKSKMFCACSNDSFGAEPNTNVCPICMGFPGMLPAVNRAVVEKGIAAATALGCKITPFSKFDRKNYFYPDLPKGFQISQYDQPISRNGGVEIATGSGKKRIRVNRLHLEDDAGKLSHTASGTLCDYNRSGAPLMEIVSEPDLSSVEEASSYAQEIQRILRYVGASDCDMEKGMMRFDINVSLRKKGVETLGVKVEVKNLNSFRSLERALQFEIARQAQMLEEGEKILQETRGWDDEKGMTVSLRSKEGAHDYRYFPEPDIPPLSGVEMKGGDMELPLARKERFVVEYGLSEEDAGILAETRGMADYFEVVVKTGGDAKKAVSFINTIMLKHLHRDFKSLQESPVRAEDLGKLIALVNAGTVTNNMAKAEIFEAMYATGKSPEEIVKERGLAVVSDSGEIEALCKKVIEENSGPVADYRSGKQNAFGFLVGQAMKATKGKGNPKLINETLRKLL